MKEGVKKLFRADALTTFVIGLDDDGGFGLNVKLNNSKI
jgi:hypothetical protein